jgi:iron complex outermembrane receptor protein
MTTRLAILLAASALSSGLAAPAAAQTVELAQAQTVEQLRELSIEQLAQVEVRSVSKHAEPLSKAPAAAYVLTAADIQSAPATSLPEVLRLAPNLQVQRIDARQYAITARGFNGAETANKLLVLVDGRSIYSTLHSGIFWELHAPLLEDLQQIEVISGPGGTLFGPNAVNGVININSKDARDTIGGLIRGTAGAGEQTAGIRYGVPLGASGAVRFYANGFNRSDIANTTPTIDQDFKGIQGGFRADFGAESDIFTVQGDVFATDTGGVPGDGDEGHNLLARWSRTLAPDMSFQIQGYYDKFVRRFILVKDKLETFDLEGQFNLSAGRHTLVLGAGVRTTKDEFINNLNGFVLDPESRRLWVINAFAQDEIALSDTFSLTAGLKVERSSLSGVELLPNVRLAWHPNERTLLWAAASRAVRTPSRIDRQLVFLPLLAQAVDFRSEKLIALEAGYRGQFGDSTSLSISLFYNIYGDLRTTELAPGNMLPIRLANGLKGNNYGLEAWAAHQLTPWWRINLGLSTLAKDFDVKRGHVDIANGASLGADPDYQVTVRSQMNLDDRIRLDVAGRMVGDLGNPELDGYVEADARLGWDLTDRIELYVVGHNLLHKRHYETAPINRGLPIERSVQAGTRLLF